MFEYFTGYELANYIDKDILPEVRKEGRKLRERFTRLNNSKDSEIKRLGLLRYEEYLKEANDDLNLKLAEFAMWKNNRDKYRLAGNDKPLAL